MQNGHVIDTKTMSKNIKDYIFDANKVNTMSKVTDLLKKRSYFIIDFIVFIFFVILCYYTYNNITRELHNWKPISFEKLFVSSLVLYLIMIGFIGYYGFYSYDITEDYFVYIYPAAAVVIALGCIEVYDVL